MTYPSFDDRTFESFLTSEVSKQNDTLVAAPGIAFPIGASASEVWEFEATLYFEGANTTHDVKVGWDTLPSGGAQLHGLLGIGGAAVPGFGAVAVGNTPTVLVASTTVLTHGTASGTIGLVVKGKIIGGGTAGLCQLMFAQNTTNANNLTIKFGSWIRVKRVRD